ncbi:kelch-like protein 2 [Oculina patagonica]
MAFLRNLAYTAKQAISAKDVFSEVDMPKDTLDQPCDITLVVENGKKFKAHRQVLSEASPFFEKLLNSDMKESKEGIVRLGMFSDSATGKTLEFIYAGNVEILSEDDARDLIVMADYLLIENLKTLTERFLLGKLNISNCISTYYFSERYQCKELVSETKKFIFANFTSLFKGDRKNVLNMPSKEIQMWISSNEINVTAEEDVFKIILAWIDHDKSKRKKYFAELFRHVQLVYVSRDFLCSEIWTNGLVSDNDEGCLDLVEDAMRLLESRNYDRLPVTPRKSLEVPVIVACSPAKGRHIQHYFPREDRWYSLGEMPFSFVSSYLVGPCHGKIYGIQYEFASYRHRMVSFNPYTNKWMLLPSKEDRDLKQIFVANENEMNALVSEPCKNHRVHPRYYLRFHTEVQFCDKEKHVSLITKYKPESNSWEDISSFDHMCLKFKL